MLRRETDKADLRRVLERDRAWAHDALADLDDDLCAQCDGVNGVLVAVTGAHVVSKARGVAAVGNVFVRPDCRRRGLAQRTLSATITAIHARGLDTVGLNVARANRRPCTPTNDWAFAPR